MRRTLLPVAGLTLLLAVPVTLAAPAPMPQDDLLVLSGPPTPREARQLQDAGDFEAAAELWSAIAEANPDSSQAWFNLGYCLHGAGHLERAVEIHKKAAQFEDVHGIAMYNLGCAYALLDQPDHALEALADAHQSGFDVSERLFTDSDLESLREDPRIAMFFEGGGGGGMSGGSKLQQIMMKAQQMAQQFAPQAQAMMEQFAPQAKQMIGEMFPEAQGIIEEIEMQMGGRGAPQSEEDHAQAQHELDEKVAQAQEELGGMVAAFAEMAKAIIGQVEQQLQHALREDPAIREGLRELAADPRFDEMMQGLHQWMEQTMGGGGGGGGLGAAMEAAGGAMEEGDFERAVMIYDQILQHDPQNADAVFMRAYGLHMSGNYESAIQAHQHAASFEQYEAIATYNLACAYALTGHKDKAFEALERCRKSGGFDLRAQIASDPDLKSLHEDERFAAFMKSLELGPEI